MYTFIDGAEELILDGVETLISQRDTALIQSGVKHAIKAIAELHIIEVQIGDELY